jgi:hypothetical protein
MDEYSNILCRLARFLAGIPPDAATMLLAVLENLHGLVWVLNAWAGELFVLYTVAILVRCLWPLLPARVQRVLLKVRDFFWPWAESQDQVRDQSRDIADLKERVRELERLHGSPPTRHPDDLSNSTEIPDEKRKES